jgi:eukaryotic-like serine/threonine-protein kinase
MSRQERLDELLARWDEAREQGHEATPEELARGDPDLLDDLRAAVRRLKALDWLDAPEVKPAGRRADLAGKLPALLGGRYRLERLLAEGGFSQVWRGFDTALERPVAVKVTFADCLAEARRVARLRHPGIVTVHDAGTDAGVCFIVFDLLEGPDLAGRLRAGRLPWREAVELLAAVAENLQHAHEMGLTHRDIKPANILLDARGRPVLADFGIAVTPGELRQETVSTPGTLAYMAPEQLGAAGEVGPRTDVYGLGVVLYELLTGRLPFREETLWGLRRQILTEPPPPVREQAAEVPPEVEALCLSCLAREPGRRPATAREVAEGLRACLRGASGS